jgi:hypothetical protein
LLLSLTLPPIVPQMTAAVIDRVYAVVGAPMTIGARFLDLTVDLSAVALHDCPPISHYRLVIRDRAWLRRLDVGPGESALVGASLALLSTEPEEPLDGAPARAARVGVAGVIPQMAWDKP